MMHESQILLSFLLAVQVVGCGILLALWKYLHPSQVRPLVKPIVWAMAGTVLSALLIHLPLYGLSPVEAAPSLAGMPGPQTVAASLLSAVGLFAVSYDLTPVLEAAQLLTSPTVATLYTVFVIGLFILAPVLTFVSVLSLFHNAFSDLRFHLPRRRGSVCYVFSELNERSMALAKSIAAKRLKPRPLLLFTNVFDQEEGGGYDLREEARQLRAVCLKKDVPHLQLPLLKQPVEVFFIGDNETENVRKATQVVRQLSEHGQKKDVKLFVFSMSQGSGYTLDSLRYDNLLTYQGCTLQHQDDCFAQNRFKLRRVDPIRQLVLDTVPKMNLLDKARDGTLSVMIAGVGAYGTEFFKMLVWYCQVEGYRLELNLFDAASGDQGPRAILHRQCPELIEVLDRHGIGDADYSIQIYEGVDFRTDAFANLLEESPRLRRTDVILVTLGDDDVNIETAVYLRHLFDRKLRISAKVKDGKAVIPAEKEIPAIYAIVYDGTKSGAVQADNMEWLVNHKEVPYHIHFIGSIHQQYAYDCIYKPEVETEAYRYHIQWAEVNRRACEEMRAAGYSEEEIKQSGFAYNQLDPAEEARRYERFEYFRHSSIANFLHQQLLEDNGLYPSCEVDPLHPRQLCTCDHCIQRKRMEHSRWNAYMRSEGYTNFIDRDGEGRADRALKHDKLCHWDQLSNWDRAKD